jgi:hypothetical protein
VLRTAIGALAIAVLLGCSLPSPEDQPSQPSSDPAPTTRATPTAPPTPTPTSTPTATPTPSPTPSPSKTQQRRQHDRDGEDQQQQPQAAEDCAAYRNSGSWCTNGTGDYDCQGGGGDGPNYAPPGIKLRQPGTDPFGLDRDNDGEACEKDRAPAEPAPPPPPPDPGTDPQFGTCGEAKAAGYGPYYQGQDPEYDWYRDADGDGVVCE